MEKKNQAWIWVGIVVVVIIVVFALVWKPSSGTPSVPPGTASFAPQGQVVAGFPKSLILQNGEPISSSYAINYSQNANQYSAEWNSSDSLYDIFTEYNNYLSSNGWTITNRIEQGNLYAVYASQGSSTVNAAASLSNGETRVTVSYST